MVKCLGDVGNEVLGILQTAAEADQIGAHTGGIQLLVRHLTVGSRGGVEAAGTGVGHMGLDGAQLQMFHEHFRGLPSAIEAEGNDTAGAVRHILLGQIIILVTLQAAVLDPVHLFMTLEIFCNGLGIGAMLLHTEGEAFQTDVQNVGILGGLAAAEVPHQLCGALGDEGTADAEPLGVCDTMVAVVGGTQTGELVSVLGPVEFAAVDNAAANGGGVSVDVLGGGMGHDVGTPFDGTAVDGGCEGVVHDQGDTVFVSGLCEFLNVQNGEGGVGNGLTEDRLGVGAEGSIQLFLGAVGINESGLQTHLLHGNRKQVEAAAVDSGTGDDVVAAGGDIEYCQEVGCLTGGGQHSGAAAFQGADLFCHSIAGGIGQPGVEVAVGFQIKELAHVFGSVILEGGALNDGNLPGLAVAGSVACLDAESFGSKFVHNGSPLKM